MSSRIVGTPGHDHAFDALARASNAQSEAIVLFHSWVAQRMGLDPTAYKTLFPLQRRGPLSAGKLTRETGLAAASVTDLIDRLVAKGFVTREPHPKDRRRIVVTLIEDAVMRVRSGFGVPNPSLRDLCADYDPEQLEFVADFLNRNALRLQQDLHDAFVEEGIRRGGRRWPALTEIDMAAMAIFHPMLDLGPIDPRVRKLPDRGLLALWLTGQRQTRI